MQMMLKYKVQLIIPLAIIFLFFYVQKLPAETWQLEQGQDWKSVQTKNEDKYLLVIVRTENLLNSGQTLELYEEWNNLRTEFPEIEKQDMDLFIEAELLFCEQKFTKASLNYMKFLDKDYHDSKLHDIALERLFRIAKAYLAGQKKTVLGIFRIKGYAEGIKIMENITDRASDKPIGIQAAVAVAESYEKRKMFNEAHLKWSEISWQWKTGEIAKQALLSMAKCKHAAYKGPKYNASCLDSAKTYYENYKLRYPQDVEKLGIDEILKQINEQAAYKQLSVGRYYQKTGNNLAANLYYQMIINNWPETESAELAKEALAGN
ncbi:MAG: hypothetical protein A2173_05490 [Planctomycetes bacterium RBG_13_44_8b]|nr:MAG: hypothetical protein A2173_05490 [Planctomycetes bacterium RBG_13_44_8b]